MRRARVHLERIPLAEKGVDRILKFGGKAIEQGVGRLRAAFRRVVHSHLQSVNEDGCATRTNATVAEPVHDLMEGKSNPIAIKPGWNLDARLWRALFALRGNAAGVVVTKSVAARGRRLTVQASGHDMMACLDHMSSFPRYPPLSPAPRHFVHLLESKMVAGADLCQLSFFSKS